MTKNIVKIEKTVPVIFTTENFDLDNNGVLCFFSNIESAELASKENYQPEVLSKNEILATMPLSILVQMPYFLIEKNLIEEFVKWNKENGEKINVPSNYCYDFEEENLITQNYNEHILVDSFDDMDDFICEDYPDKYDGFDSIDDDDDDDEEDRIDLQLKDNQYVNYLLEDCFVYNPRKE